jgi:hypothetical protein
MANPTKTTKPDESIADIMIVTLIAVTVMTCLLLIGIF